MIRELDLEGGPTRLGGWRAARLPLVVVMTIGVIGGLVGATLTSRSARAAGTPSMTVGLTVSSPEVAGSGGRVIYTYVVTNTADAGSIELIELRDDLLGELDDAGTCTVPQTIAAEASYTCMVAIDLVDRAGSTIVTTVVAGALAEDGTELVERSTATITATEHARLIISHSGTVRVADGVPDGDDHLLGVGVDLGDGGVFGGGLTGGSGSGGDGDDLLLGDSDTTDSDAEGLGETQELGHAEHLVDAPRPIECDGEQWSAAHGVHMGDFRTAELSVDTALSLAAGRWSVEDLVLHDADIDRPFYPQADERLRVEFWRGGTMVAATASTTDLIDGHVSAWSRGSLGSVVLPDGADRVLLVHSNVFDGTSGTNSFEPRSLCLTRAPSASPADQLGDSLLDRPDLDEGVDESDLDPDGDADDNQVEFVIVIENVGAVPVFGLEITDAVVDELQCDGDVDQLDAGQTLTCTGTYAATADEVLYGSVQSTIRVDTLQTLPRTTSTRVALPAIG